MKNRYNSVIGLEVHIELATRSKMFCGCSAKHFGKKANTQVCPVCLGLPGALPKVNKEAIREIIKMGKAFDCEIKTYSKFDRKHYFYPDLPKGYQISQYDMPICTNGQWRLSKGKVIRIRRIHLEEDTGKLIHDVVKGRQKTFVDFNRSGVPLIELVTEPDFEDEKDVLEFLKEVQLIVRYLGISDADMEKGSMRLEANISLTVGQHDSLPSYKVELKNINSFKFLDKAIRAELNRQEGLLSSGQKVIQETRGFDEKKQMTIPQRVKEEAQDYRYFPEPDIPPLTFSKKFIEDVVEKMPVLPNTVRERLNELGLKEDYREILVQDKKRAEFFFESVVLAEKRKVDIRKIAHAMINLKLDATLKEPVALIKKIKELEGANFTSEGETIKAVEATISEEEKGVIDFKKGKSAVLGYLIGQTQKRLQGKGEIGLIKRILMEKLKS